MTKKNKIKRDPKKWWIYAGVAIAIVLLLYWLFAGTLIEEDETPDGVPEFVQPQ